MATNEGVTFTDSDNITVTVSISTLMTHPTFHQGTVNGQKGFSQWKRYGLSIAISLVVTVTKPNEPLKIELQRVWWERKLCRSDYDLYNRLHRLLPSLLPYNLWWYTYCCH